MVCVVQGLHETQSWTCTLFRDAPADALYNHLAARLIMFRSETQSAPVLRRTSLFDLRLLYLEKSTEWFRSSHDIGDQYGNIGAFHAGRPGFHGLAYTKLWGEKYLAYGYPFAILILHKELPWATDGT